MAKNPEESIENIHDTIHLKISGYLVQIIAAMIENDQAKLAYLDAKMGAVAELHDEFVRVGIFHGPGDQEVLEQENKTIPFRPKKKKETTH